MSSSNHNSTPDGQQQEQQREGERAHHGPTNFVHTGITGRVSHYEGAHTFVMERPLHLKIQGDFIPVELTSRTTGTLPSSAPNPNTGNQGTVEYHKNAHNYRSFEPTFADFDGNFYGSLESFRQGQPRLRSTMTTDYGTPGVFHPHMTPPYLAQEYQARQSAHPEPRENSSRGTRPPNRSAYNSLTTPSMQSTAAEVSASGQSSGPHTRTNVDTHAEETLAHPYGSPVNSELQDQTSTPNAEASSPEPLPLEPTPLKYRPNVLVVKESRKSKSNA